MQWIALIVLLVNDTGGLSSSPVLILLNTETQIWNNFYFLVNKNNNNNKILLTVSFDKAKSDTQAHTQL